MFIPFRIIVEVKRKDRVNLALKEMQWNVKKKKNTNEWRKMFSFVVYCVGKYFFLFFFVVVGVVLIFIMKTIVANNNNRK